jgi:ATP-dependent RNA helicase DDX54/DBP10
MSYYQKDADTEKGYSLRDGASFAEQAHGVTFDLTGDEALQERKRRGLRWDKQKKKFVKGTGEGADNVKLVKTESGVKLPATYRSGRFEEWKSKARVSLPRVGEAEEQSTQRRGHGPGGRKWKHNQQAEAKPLDKMGKNYERKMRQFKKKNEGAEPASVPAPQGKGKGKKALGGRFGGGEPLGKAKNELKTVDQIRKSRTVAEKRRLKNARPTHKGKKGRR